MEKIITFIFNHTILSITWVISLVLFIFFIIKEKKNNIKIIDCYETTYKLNKEKAIIFDIRKKEDYTNGHIFSSINISIEEEDKKNILKKINQYKEKNIPVIIIYYSENNKMLNFTKYLRNAGFQEILVLKSGILGWSKENLPLVINKK